MMQGLHLVSYLQERVRVNNQVPNNKTDPKKCKLHHQQLKQKNSVC